MFDIDRVGRSGAQWNDEKLDWLNKEHLKRMDGDAQHAFVSSFLTSDVTNHLNYSTDLLKKLTPLIVDRIHKGADITALCEDGELDYFLAAPTVSRDQPHRGRIQRCGLLQSSVPRAFQLRENC